MLTAEIAACCKELKLSRNIVEMAERVQAESHQEYLLKLLQSELEHRESQRKDKFLKNAGFYSIKTLDGFRFDEVTLPAAVSPDYLRNCEFINTKTNLVMYGNVGTGKTLSIHCPGSRSLQKGHRNQILQNGRSGQSTFGSQKERHSVRLYEEARQSGTFDLRRMGLCASG